MPSRSVSISPGSAAPAERVGRPARGSLRTAVLWAFVPLCLVASSGVAALWFDARAVHVDLQRLFEELREVSLTRSLLDEIHGFQHWVRTVPEGRASTHQLVASDLHRHLDAARATYARFSQPDDPSMAEHHDEEAGTLARILESLDEAGRRLDADRTFAELAEPLKIAVHGAEALSHTVDNESREIGDQLDHRSTGRLEAIVLLGAASLATVAWLGYFLLRRVLVPVRDLRTGAVEFGHGRLDVAIPVRHSDELGELAATFSAMASAVRKGREELEQRVEERSREVLRTAQLAELGTLAAGIAHEVNNPLASIATCAEGLLRETAGDGPIDRAHLRDYLQIVRNEAMRTRDLTARLLRFARHDAGRRETVWLGTELREVSAMFEHQFADAGVRLDVVADVPGPAILGEPAAWRQVLLNLLRNALDATPRGGTVTATAGREGAEVLLEVSDTGTGIAPETLDRVFEPFFTTKGPGQGTGLGLAIVHRIVTDHSGSIRAGNGPAGGARFTVTLPAATG